jgi:hypothetical protein
MEQVPSQTRYINAGGSRPVVQAQIFMKSLIS